MSVAALYVDVERGPYAHISGVDCWGEERDARLYRGPHPVVAHPPCTAWIHGLRISRHTFIDRWRWDSARFDADSRHMSCGPIAVHQVRRFGGVLEHPAKSALWEYAGLPKPGILVDRFGGYTVEVAQGAYGHPAPKLTWLYIVGVDPGGLALRPYHDPGGRVLNQWSTARHITPPEFAALLVSIARRALLTGARP